MTFGEKIRKRRIELGMTMDDLGRLVGLQRSAINKYEKNMIKDPTRTMISKFARALDMSPLDLMDDVKEVREIFATDAIPEQIRKEAEQYFIEMTTYSSAPLGEQIKEFLTIWNNMRPEARRLVLPILEEMEKEK